MPNILFNKILEVLNCISLQITLDKLCQFLSKHYHMIPAIISKSNDRIN
jgi:hypothetical protein